MKEDLSINIVSSISQVEDLDLTLDIAEFTIDQLLEDGILKDIPWVGWIFKAKSVYTSISDRILLTKILKFLVSLKNISYKEKQNFIREIEINKKFRNKVGAKLLLVIDRMNDYDKVDILSIVFSAYLNNEIDYNIFSQIAQAIENCFISDFKALAKNEIYSLENLQRCGLARYKTTFNTVPTYDQMKITIPMELSELGEKVQEILIKYKFNL